jgi:hypothetical protein
MKFYYKDGSVLDYRNDDKILHREDGPAVEWEYDGKAWYINGEAHRLDGPAVEWASGRKSWYIDGKFLTEEQFTNHPKVQHYRFSILLEEVLCEL